MTVSASKPKIGLASRLVNGVLAIKPLADFAKNRARNMMIERAEAIGVPWRENVKKLAAARTWDQEIAAVENRDLQYPDYYTTSFHAYESGNLSWKAAWEVESASHAVHAKIWSTVPCLEKAGLAVDRGRRSDGDVSGDSMLRQSYHQVLQAQKEIAPKAILDLGCGVGLSTFALQEIYPDAEITGVDLSPYFLAVAQYKSQQNETKIDWVHCPAESTGLASNSFDLVSASLMFHELPSTAAKEIIIEARRLLRPGGHLAIMDMNPRSEIFRKMPPYVLTLLKSTEPYLDQYFALNMEQVFIEAGFSTPEITVNSPRHRTIIAKAN